MTDITASQRWRHAVRAAEVFAVDPQGLGGLQVRARPGPVRDAWLALLARCLGTIRLRKMPATIDEDRLLGGLDLAATLKGTGLVAAHGFLAESHGAVVQIAMAEQLTASTAAHLGFALDCGSVHVERDGLTIDAPAGIAVVAIDEGDDEHCPVSLQERLAFSLDLHGIGLRDIGDNSARDAEVIAQARTRRRDVQSDDSILEALCAAAAALGIGSARAPLLALRAARSFAALDARRDVNEDDAREAAALVLAPRATQMPAPQDETVDPPDQQPEDDPQPEARGDDIRALDDVVLDAAKAAIPAGLLAQLLAGAASPRAARSAGKAGQMQHGLQRGRIVGVRQGLPRNGARLDIIATLRAAAPFQRLRARSAGAGPIALRRDDFRTKRFKESRRTTTIFLVDASGSSALHRLAEAKGAVRLLLGECYIRRDEVALISFRNQTAELVLPPTRALVRAERALAALPGGGGTPLAAGLDAAILLADAQRRLGRTPTLVLMTDGRANVARDGSGRVRAQEDARSAGRAWRLRGMAAIVVDTSATPHPLAAEIAREMNARYLPLPHADARGVNAAIKAIQRTTAA